MNVAQVVTELLRYPPDANVVFSKVFVVPANQPPPGTTEEEKAELEPDEEFICVIDVPVIGVAHNPDDNEVRFVIGAKNNVTIILNNNITRKEK